jgi:acyl-CoA synthetase (NDP forming)
VYLTLVEALVEDTNVDAIAMQLPPRALNIPREFFRAFARALRARKPVALWLAGVPSGRHEILEWLEDQHVVVFPSPEKTIKALYALHRSSLCKE